MTVAELITLLRRAPPNALVCTAYDSMVCIDDIDEDSVWFGTGYEWESTTENADPGVIIPKPTVFICAPSAAIEGHKNYPATRVMDLP